MKTIQKIAHRGASGYAPENTMASFKKAVEMGASSIEFDVQQTLDNKLVIVHDADLKRVGGVESVIARMKYPQLAKCDVGSWFNARFKGEKVPLLDELISLTEKNVGRKIELQLEVKNDFPHYKGIEKRILDVIGASKALYDRTVISSFDHPTLFRIRELDPKVRLGYLVGTASPAAARKQVVQLNCESVHFSLRRVSPAWIKPFTLLKKRILVYTVNKPEDLSRMIDLGVDAVFTNFPDLEVK